MNSFEEKITFAREKSGLTKKDLGKAIGVSGTTVASYEKGDIRPRPNVLKKMCEVLNVNLEWLYDEEKSSQSSSEARKISFNKEKETFRQSPPGKVPVVSWARAGQDGFNYDDLGNHIDEWVDCDTKDKNAFALIIEGDSMSPGFEAGDVVVFSPNSEPRNGDIVVARHLESGSVYFKKFKRIGPEGAIAKLISINENYSDLEIPIKEFRFIYPAIQATKKLR